MTSEHKEFIKRSIKVLQHDERIMGLAVAGSFITNAMDEFSDIDFVIAVDSKYYNEILDKRIEIAKSLGHLLSAFTGEHVGEPRLLICLYNNPLIHVDLKFVSIDEIAYRVEDFKVLWERDNCISDKLKEESAQFPNPDLQWIEDRFWIWIHYGAGKIGRGEIFETIEFISYLRQNVIGPLILMKKGKRPQGVRKIEFDAPEYLERLKSTIAIHEK